MFFKNDIKMVRIKKKISLLNTIISFFKDLFIFFYYLVFNFNIYINQGIWFSYSFFYAEF